MHRSVPGLEYISAFMSEEMQRDLLEHIDRELWLTDLKRRVQHYGFKYDYRSRQIDSSMNLGSLPDWLTELVIEPLMKDDRVGLRAKPDQAIVNEYLPGQGISAHIDNVHLFEEEVVSLTLGSQCMMEFAPLYASEPKERVEVLLEQGSLVILRGQARYGYTHCIRARKSDQIDGKRIKRDRRVSLTLRQMKC